MVLKEKKRRLIIAQNDYVKPNLPVVLARPAVLQYCPPGQPGSPGHGAAVSGWQLPHHTGPGGRAGGADSTSVTNYTKPIRRKCFKVHLVRMLKP